MSLLAAAAQAQKASDDDPTPENLHAYGVAELLVGHYDAAIVELEAACAAAPHIAAFYADLSAAYLTRAQAETRVATLEDFARAVDAAERALEGSARLDEARFNLALALDSIGLRGETISAWNSYLHDDPASDWSHEATARLDATRAISRDRSRCIELQVETADALIAATAECPQEARELGETLLSQWAKAVVRHDATAAIRALSRADQVGRLVASHNGDRMLADTVAWIRNHADRTMKLAEGHDALDTGRALYSSDQRHKALGDYLRARTLLQNAGSPYWLVAQQNIATLHTHKRELAEASRILDDIGKQAAARRYLALQARTAWLYGVVKLQMSDPSGALDEYQRAVALYDRLGERGNLSNVSNAAADTQRILGDFERGWSSLRVSLTNLPAISDPTRRYLALYNGALYAHREQLERAALHFQNAALLVARTRAGPAGVIEGSVNKAAILGRLHRVDEALVALNEAVDGVARLEDPQQSAYMTARVSAVKGELLMERSPTDSVKYIAAAIEHFSIAEPADVPRLRLLEGKAYARAADEEHAADALVTGLTSFESRLHRLRQDQQRVAYSDEGWELYQQLVQLRVHQGELDQALLLSERARSRATADGETRVSIARLSSLLEASQRVVFYAVLPSECHAWVFGPHGVAHHTIPMGEAELGQIVSQAEHAMLEWHGATTRDALLATLYNTLITPLELPESAREIIFIPDGPLRQVPFAALRDRAGHHLVERWAVVASHSLGSLTRALERQPEHYDRSGVQALVVGDPRFDPTRSGRLPDLPFAAHEATSIAQLYKNSTLLVGGHATRARVLAMLSDVDVFHFAGHAVANDEFPELSRLLLTPAGTDSGELLARDLGASRLRRGAIVILSACQTASGLERRAAGVQSLARAFLAVGASDVVAASWDVDDRDTSQLMTTFHTHLAHGESPGQSLRAAQLALMTAGRPVSSWAAFVPFTGALSE